MRLSVIAALILGGSVSNGFITPRISTRPPMKLNIILRDIEWLDAIRSEEDPCRLCPEKVAKLCPDVDFYVADPYKEIDLCAYWYKPQEGMILTPGFEEQNRKVYGVNPDIDEFGNFVPRKGPDSSMLPKGDFDVEFTINPDGTFSYEVKGVKGPDCLKVADYMNELYNIDTEKSTMTMTEEYYEDAVTQDAFVEMKDWSSDDFSGDSTGGDGGSTAW